MAQTESIQVGDIVRCLANSIDRQAGKDAVGRVEGFARFSAYHPREVLVVFDDRPSDSGWFWLNNVVAA